MTTLNDTLRAIAAFGNLDADALIAFAAEDNYGGRGDYPNSGSMCITRAEGQILYALVRALQPMNVVEVGCYIGVSSTHILAALAGNDRGWLLSIDMERQGMIIPPDLMDLWTFEQGEAREHIWQSPTDFVFEDGDHTRDLTSTILRSAIANGARCVVSHDAHNASVGTEVRGGFEDIVGSDYLTVMVDDVALGLAIWFKRTGE